MNSFVYVYVFVCVCCVREIVVVIGPERECQNEKVSEQARYEPRNVTTKG